MVSYVFDKILNSPNRPAASAAARDWFRGEAENISTGSVTPGRLMGGNRSALMTKLLPGRMFMFTYNPKLKDKLPYYDTFPLCIPIDISSKSFLGLNLHYLPPGLRAKMMDALWNVTANKASMDEKTKVAASYEVMKGISSLSPYKACIKKYLFSNVTSQFLFIEPEKWDIALMLPTQRFKKASINTVYKDSVKKAK